MAISDRIDCVGLLWGKTNPFKSLIHHLIDTGCIAMALLSIGSFAPTVKLLADYFKIDEDDIINTIAYWSALHDIGKCHPSFQQYAKDTEAYKYLFENNLLITNEIFNENFRHEQYTLCIVNRLFTEKSRAARKSAKQIARILSFHHQGTAVDDMVGGEFNEDSGAGMVGDVDFNSCCYYIYASIDTDQMQSNLKNSAEALKLVR